ncbi:MAG TPA: F0F1 ATP synthase subunit B [Methylomirabilota bacterium]
MLRLEWSTIVFQLVNFLILLAVLGRFLYRPLMDAVRRREQAIADRLGQADERAKQADAERSRLAEAARAAQAEAEALVARARVEATQLEEKAQTNARQETARLLDDAKRRISEEERAAQHRLSTAARDSAVRITARLIGRVAGRAFHDALLARLFDSPVDLDPAKVELLRRAWNHRGHEVIVESAYPLPAETAARLDEALVKALGPGGGGVHATIKVEPSLIAGLRIVVGVGVVDLSLSRLLDDLQQDAAVSEP